MGHIERDMVGRVCVCVTSRLPLATSGMWVNQAKRAGPQHFKHKRIHTVEKGNKESFYPRLIGNENHLGNVRKSNCVHVMIVQYGACIAVVQRIRRKIAFVERSIHIPSIRTTTVAKRPLTPALH